MKPVSDLHFRVIDKGLFLSVARRLARDAAAVTYWTPHERPFPSVRDNIAAGFPDIQRVQSPWTDAEEVDCWVFPDIGFSHLQQELVAQGKKVWGARSGDFLEISRQAFLTAIAEAGLPVAPHVRIEGMAKLKEHLHDKEDLWIKISRYRGDIETWHWRSWGEDEGRLHYLAAKLGPYAEELSFYVFDPIDTENEDGCDTWCIDGACPELVIHGMEAKDKAYLGTWQRYRDLPEELRLVNDKFAPVLARYGYRSFFSTEVRITKQGESYFIDPTCRAGSPPAQVMTEMIANYGQVIWGGANGKVIEPEPAARFGVQALVCAKRQSNEWACARVTDELDRWLKCGNCIWREDHLWFPPEPDNPDKDVGWLVGVGDLMDEPIRHLQHNVKLLPDGLTCDFSALADLIREIQEAEKAGMKFTDQQVPEPQIVIEK